MLWGLNFTDEESSGEAFDRRLCESKSSEHYGFFLGLNFTGKETDCETGYSYFGARYYDPTLLTSWTAIDPMSDKYPRLSPYNYCAWNPMKLVDPDERDVWEVSNDGRIKKTSEEGGSKRQTVIYANGHIAKFKGAKYHQVMTDLSKESDNSVSTSYGNPSMLTYLNPWQTSIQV